MHQDKDHDISDLNMLDFQDIQHLVYILVGNLVVVQHNFVYMNRLVFLRLKIDTEKMVHMDLVDTDHELLQVLLLSIEESLGKKKRIV